MWHPGWSSSRPPGPELPSDPTGCRAPSSPHCCPHVRDSPLHPIPSLPAPCSCLMAGHWGPGEPVSGLVPPCHPPPAAPAWPTGALPGPAGAQPRLPLCLTSILVDETICHPCFSPPVAIPPASCVNSASINTLTLGPGVGTAWEHWPLSGGAQGSPGWLLPRPPPSRRSRETQAPGRCRLQACWVTSDKAPPPLPRPQLCPQRVTWEAGLPELWSQRAGVQIPAAPPAG